MAAIEHTSAQASEWTGRHIGSPASRVDGVAKVTGEARYAAEFVAPDLLYGCVVTSAIAKGRIESIDTQRARAVPGVVEVLTHENRPHIAWFDRSYTDDDAPPGEPFRALRNADIAFSAQPIALVVAQDFETARYAASLVETRYTVDEHETELVNVRDEAFEPKRKKSGYKPPPSRGDADAALAAADVRHRSEYRIAIEHHNPMELHATTVIWRGEGRLLIHDKTQGPQNTYSYVCRAFGFAKDDVEVYSPYVGGAFGSGLRPQHQLYLAVLAAKALQRSVRVVLSREQMFTFGYRPDDLQTFEFGAQRDGTLTAIKHDSIQNTSQFENYSETIVNWSGLLYACTNLATSHRLARLDLYTPIDMRAPGAASGVNAFEAAIDELAYELRMDPLQLRLKNYVDHDQNEDKPLTSKALRECYAQGAERFGWSQRSLEPRSMRDGRELVGWGVATGVWEANQQKARARARFNSDGHLEIATGSVDIGTGTYTILAQIAAESFGLPLAAVTVRLGESSAPQAPLEGGSWTAASVGAAVKSACDALQKLLLKQAHSIGNSPLGKARMSSVAFERGDLVLKKNAASRLPIRDIVLSAGGSQLEAEGKAGPSLMSMARFSRYTHSAVFAEVKVDEELGQIRVTRIVSAIAGGRVINPKTARSQIIGGVVFGMGMALMEESMLDHRLGRFMNHNYAEYHIPTNADIHDIDVIFVDEQDLEINALGVKGLGEIGVVGTAGAIANAVFHATGKRVREWPITLDKVIC
jgi:xanthine dehydrogenase YagR molybdenum-binding subunit